VTSTGENSEETESVWRPGAVSEFKLMMDEEEFNIKLVELKQVVSLCDVHQGKTTGFSFTYVLSKQELKLVLTRYY